MPRPAAFTEFKNIRTLPSGYQVTLVRSGNEFSRHFAGHSERSYRAAIRFRDRTLRELPDKRLNKIPRKVLAALGLMTPVVGVFRHPNRSMYQVSYKEQGRQRSRGFSWGGETSEVEAYERAIAFRKKMIRGKVGKRTT